LARIEPILSDLEEANYSVSGTAELRGTVRVGVASVTASRIIVRGRTDSCGPIQSSTCAPSFAIREASCPRVIDFGRTQHNQKRRKAVETAFR
jgi:hypothetical protein